MKNYIKDKKMSLLRVLALLTALLITVMSMGGCAQDSGDNSDSSDSSLANGSAENSVKNALKKGADESLDLGGKTLTISAWGEPTAEGEDEYMDRRYELERRTEERYNVNIEWIPSDTGSFVQDVVLAYTSGKKYADLMFSPSYYGYDLARVGAVLPLDDYIDYSSKHYSLTADNLLYVDGKHYSYMPDEYSVNSVGYFVLYNTTILEKAGCEDPMTLYEEGKWDWDAFKEIVKKTTIVENGETVQYGVGGSNLLPALCLSNGFSLVDINEDTKKFECGLYNDAGFNVLNYLSELTYTIKGCDGRFSGHNSKLTFGDSKCAMLISTAYYPSTFITDGMTIESVPMPKGPDANGYTNGLEMQEWWMVSAISDFKAEELVQIALDMNDNDPAYEDTYFSEEGKKENFITRTYEGNVFTTEEECELFFNFITDDEVDTILNISVNDLKEIWSENILTPISKGEDPRVVLERQKSVITTALQNMLPDSLK